MKFNPTRWANADTRAAEAISGLVATSYSLILFLPGETMVTPAFRIMRLVGDDLFWAAIFATAGVIQILAMFTDTVLFRKAGVLLTLLLWLIVSITIALSNYLAPGWVVYAILASSMLWVLISGPTFTDED